MTNVKKTTTKKTAKHAAKKAVKKMTGKLSALNEADGIIGIEEAIDRAGRWRQYWEGADQDNYIKAFFIRKEDIEQLYKHICANDNAIGCRGYFGKSNSEVAGVPADTLSMMFVVVEAAEGFDDGKDILANPDQPTISEIYDFTNPCPTTCDMSSELYGPQSALKMRPRENKR